MNSTNKVNSRQDDVIDEFDMFSDWMEKYEHIIEIGKDLSPMKEEDKVEQNLIKGCQSRVWLSAKLNSEGEVIFSADSDAIITKGLVALMLHILSGSQASEIAAADLYFLEKIGLNAHLSPTRSNGLASMVKQMKMYGLVFSARS
jgi:cysteine desulfuration protein SufE